MAWIVMEDFIYLLWCVSHRQTDEVTAGQGKEQHDDDKPPVVGEKYGQKATALNVTEHQQRNEDHTGDH